MLSSFQSFFSLSSYFLLSLYLSCLSLSLEKEFFMLWRCSSQCVSVFLSFCLSLPLSLSISLWPFACSLADFPPHSLCISPPDSHSVCVLSASIPLFVLFLFSCFFSSIHLSILKFFLFLHPSCSHKLSDLSCHSVIRSSTEPLSLINQ